MVNQDGVAGPLKVAFLRKPCFFLKNSCSICSGTLSFPFFFGWHLIQSLRLWQDFTQVFCVLEGMLPRTRLKHSMICFLFLRWCADCSTARICCLSCCWLLVLWIPSAQQDNIELLPRWEAKRQAKVDFSRVVMCWPTESTEPRNLLHNTTVQTCTYHVWCTFVCSISCSRVFGLKQCESSSIDTVCGDCGLSALGLQPPSFGTDVSRAQWIWTRETAQFIRAVAPTSAKQKV